MIGFLRGRLAAKHPPQLVIDVNGVGYEVEAPMSTFYELPAIGEPLTLLTHLVVREDAQTLFGFATEDERRLFRSLLRISGVGAKMALGILSGISVAGFVRCVQTEDTASLVKVPGIGKKTAERLIVEMRDRLEGEAPAGSPGQRVQAGPAAAADEAFGALVALGYKPAEATRLLRNIDTEGLTTEEIIRRALQGAVK
jgi:Holliday junction DNA helicase RuvA